MRARRQRNRAQEVRFRELPAHLQYMDGEPSKFDKFSIWVHKWGHLRNVIRVARSRGTRCGGVESREVLRPTSK